MKVFIALLVFALSGGTAMAADWGEFAIVSGTLGMNSNRLCISESTRGEIGCPTYAPFLDPSTQYVGIGTATPSVTFTVSGSTFSNDLMLLSVAGAAPVSNTVSSGGGGGATALSGLSDVTLSGSTTGDLLYYNGSAWVNQASSGLFSADRITSATSQVIANSAAAGGYISLTAGAGGTVWGYLGSSATYLPTLNTAMVSSTRVSATTISASIVQISSPTGTVACSSSTAGALKYNSTGNYMEMCNGTGWQPMGVGVPAGTISAFASTTCPTGWSEYTTARGRFLRGIDNGAGNDPDGTRSPGATQADAFKAHNHDQGSPALRWMGSGGTRADWSSGSSWGNNYTTTSYDTGGDETRPKNVAVTYCQFNGTTNGWNNPLSGGSTTPGGSTGQLQYNTAGAFDASAGLVWDNGSSLLTATNISTTSLTVNGVAITGSSEGDRITSGTTYVLASENTSVTVRTGGTDRMIVGETGNVGIGTATPSQTLTVNGNTDVSGTVKVAGTGSEICGPATRGTFRHNPSTGKMEICRY